MQRICSAQITPYAITFPTPTPPPRQGRARGGGSVWAQPADALSRFLADLDPHKEHLAAGASASARHTLNQHPPLERIDEQRRCRDADRALTFRLLRDCEGNLQGAKIEANLPSRGEGSCRDRATQGEVIDFEETTGYNTKRFGQGAGGFPGRCTAQESLVRYSLAG
jgi:hypothetical protein